MDISLRIKELREAEGLSKKAFSESIGIDNSQYGKIENGKLLPTIGLIMEISSKYNISTDSLLFDKKIDLEENKNLNEPKIEWQTSDPGYEAFLKYLQRENTITLIKKILADRNNKL